MLSKESNIGRSLLGEDGCNLLHLTVSPSISSRHEHLACLFFYVVDTFTCYIFTVNAFFQSRHTCERTHTDISEGTANMQQMPLLWESAEPVSCRGRKSSVVFFTPALPLFFIYFPAWPVLLWPVMQGPRGLAVK